MAANFQFPSNEGTELTGSRTDSCGPKILVMRLNRPTLFSNIIRLQTKRTVPNGNWPILRVLQFLHCRKHFSALTKKFGQKFSVLYLNVRNVQTKSFEMSGSVTICCCVVHCASVYACTVHNTRATQVILCHHSTDNVYTTSISTLNQSCNFS
jgi:hypothetical protein